MFFVSTLLKIAVLLMRDVTTVRTLCPHICHLCRLPDWSTSCFCLLVFPQRWSSPICRLLCSRPAEVAMGAGWALPAASVQTCWHRRSRGWWPLSWDETFKKAGTRFPLHVCTSVTLSVSLQSVLWHWLCVFTKMEIHNLCMLISNNGLLIIKKL